MLPNKRFSEKVGTVTRWLSRDLTTASSPSTTSCRECRSWLCQLGSYGREKLELFVQWYNELAFNIAVKSRRSFYQCFRLLADFIAFDSSKLSIDTRNIYSCWPGSSFRRGCISSAWCAKPFSFISCLADANFKGSLNHSFFEFEKTGNITSSSDHTNRCIEILRQAVMCAADLTLEKLDLEDPSRTLKPQRGNSGWGNVHTRRNWTKLVEVLRQHSIVKSENGWAKLGFLGRAWIAIEALPCGNILSSSGLDHTDTFTKFRRLFILKSDLSFLWFHWVSIPRCQIKLYLS